MENWEKELRAKLELELEDGLYDLSIPGKLSCYTGKAGKIEFEVAIQHEARKLFPEKFEKPNAKAGNS